MSIYESEIWLSDLDVTIESLPELEELTGKKILVTGCTGLICSSVIDVIIRWNETHDEKIKILAAGRNKEKVNKRFYPYNQKDYFVFVPYNATSMNNNFQFECDYIIHGASNASPNHIVKEPVETMLSNFYGVKYLLDYVKKTSAKRLLYISSSEIYGRKEHDRPSKANEYGGIDILNPRNSYSISKCAAETLCSAYYDEYAVDSVIVRPGHIYGPTAQPSDNRVSSAWAYDAACGKDIVMKSDGAQIRSYCYCLDSASAIFKVLIHGESVKAYNISNPDSIITIREMANIITKSSDVELMTENPSEMEKKGFNPMCNSSLDCFDLLNLGWVGNFDAKKGFKHTVEILKSLTI